MAVMTQTFQTLFELLARGADAAPALLAPGRPALDFAGLRHQASTLLNTLNAHGIGRQDRVAIVLPNGPEMASAFVALACGCTTAPLNPVYRAEEFEFYLRDLDAQALVLTQGSDSPARTVATKLGIPVWEIHWHPDWPAGRFEFIGTAAAVPAVRPGLAAAGDIALVLHTSGTTSRPKIVPLSHANLSASARHIMTTLALTPADRCLNIMPLFHIHGLVAALLSSLAAGGSVYCTPGFNALKFFSWLADAGATWYSAVPTMHQAILARAERQPEAARAARLRFIRSSSASLAPQLLTALEQTFQAPVIEAYGMTEAAHQMTSNPLPPQPHKPGTVGIAAGPEVRIMDEQNRLLERDQIGEVVIRGPNVTQGYENNPEANSKAFSDGWFRTGDQGVLDADGYLTITGRLKELINRGGEKIAPREVDEVLLDHPAVAQAVTFAMPHPTLGEDVAAAIVLREGRNVDADTLRAFVGKRLAAFKVPRRIVFLQEIPKGATGKLQRIGLADKLGLTA